MRHTRSRGVCQNLGFTNLYQPTYELTEVLRAGTLEGSKEWFDREEREKNNAGWVLVGWWRGAGFFSFVFPSLGGGGGGGEE